MKPEDEPRTVLVTGAARRIGAVIARYFHQQGWQVLVHCHQSLAEATALVDGFNSRRASSARLLQSGLQNIDEIQELAQQASAAWGGIDALINNASSFYATPVGNISESDWQELMAANLKAPLFLSQALAPTLQQRHGAIVNVVDVAAVRPLRGFSVYCVAKAGLAMLTRSLALELAPEVRVNAVAPGSILWPVFDDQPPSPARQQALLDRIPLGRMGEPEDIASAVYEFAARSPYVTGQILAVDGGRLLQGD